jgi:hypothetical protein
MFHRAKALLINESKDAYSIPGENSKRVAKILGDIMLKLNASIDRNVSYLTRNPMITLKQHRGCNKKDVKKAYRVLALKYHPDKNQDCDSSPVFTLVQSAYERLLLTASEAPSTPNSRAGRRAEASSGENIQKPAPPSTQFRERDSSQARAAPAAREQPSYGGLAWGQLRRGRHPRLHQRL